MTNGRKTNICLNMIVKNETKVLERLFRSVKDYIDYYVIVDTGSSDGTQQLIKDRMREYGIEGEVHERPWVNFGVNRQQALELAVQAGRSDWLLFIDADEELGVSNPRFYEELQPGITYDIEKHHANIRYAVPHLVNVRDTKWRWKGPVHNYLERESGSAKRVLRKDVWILYHPGQGAKSQGVTSEQKYLRDAGLLEDDLKQNPGNPRSQFYLGQSYKHAGRLEQAFAAYKARTELDGWVEEKYMAQLECGRVAKLMKKSEGDVLTELLQAYQLRPTRAEPLYELASYYRPLKMYAKAYLFAKAGLGIARPSDTLFVAQDVYDWRLLDEVGVAAYWVGQYAEAHAACEEVLRRAEQGVAVPAADLKRVRQNLSFSETKLAS
jgi:tetratricopeptide (TPR) repeat protein